MYPVQVLPTIKCGGGGEKPSGPPWPTIRDRGPAARIFRGRRWWVSVSSTSIIYGTIYQYVPTTRYLVEYRNTRYRFDIATNGSLYCCCRLSHSSTLLVSNTVCDLLLLLLLLLLLCSHQTVLSTQRHHQQDTQCPSWLILEIQMMWSQIPLPTRAGRRWQMVWQGPRLGFVAEMGRFVAMETPWVRFSCLPAFVPCFLLFVFRFSFLSFLIFFLHPGMFTLFVSLRLCSSHLRLSASTYYFYNTCSFCLCHLHPTPSRNSMVFFYSSSIFFRSSYFSGDVFFSLRSRTRYASTWFAYLDS